MEGQVITILVTGAAGYIGSHAVLELIRHNYNVVALDNLSAGSRKSIEQVAELTSADIPFYECDLLDKEKLDSIFEEHEFEAVMHFAGLKSVKKSFEDPLGYYQNNVGGSLNLLLSMKTRGVKKLVFSSSATVYGNTERMPIKEDSPPAAINPYGRTKLMIEEILRDLAEAELGWGIAILRYFNPAGADKSGKIGERKLGVPDNLVPYITEVAAGKREYVKVFGNDYGTADGTGIRDYIHVTDLVKGHISALEYLQSSTGAEIINLGSGTGRSVLEMIREFSSVAGRDIPYRIMERRPGDMASSYADTSKAKELLDWQAEESFRSMCEDAWRWQTANNNKE